MTNDPIVEEVQRVRARLLAECGGDLHKLMDRLKEQEDRDTERRVVKSIGELTHAKVAAR